MRPAWRSYENLFMLGAAAVSLAAVLAAMSFRHPAARKFPTVWGIATFLLALAFVVLSSREGWRSRFAWLVGRGGLWEAPPGPAGAAGPEEPGAAPAVPATGRSLFWRTAAAMGALAGYALLAWVFGFYLATLAYMALVMRKIAGESRILSAALSIACTLVLYITFEVLFKVRIATQGLIFELLGYSY